MRYRSSRWGSDMTVLVSLACRMVVCVVVRTEQFDMLLLFMVNYFHWYFAKREKETYTNPVHM